MKKLLVVVMVLLACSFAFAGDNSPSRGGSRGVQAATAFFPNHSTMADINAYLTTGITSQSTRATDACLAGDIIQIINIGLPGPDVDVGQTDGSAEGCACAHSGGYDASADTSVNGAVALTIGRLVAAPGGFPLSWELLFRSPASQIRGIDACGVVN